MREKAGQFEGKIRLAHVHLRPPNPHPTHTPRELLPPRPPHRVSTPAATLCPTASPSPAVTAPSCLLPAHSRSLLLSATRSLAHPPSRPPRLSSNCIPSAAPPSRRHPAPARAAAALVSGSSPRLVRPTAALALGPRAPCEKAQYHSPTR